MNSNLPSTQARAERPIGARLSAMSLVQKLAWVYAAMFFFIAIIGYLPGLTNAAGQLFGLFKLDLYDDALHLGSGIWAAAAAWTSARASTIYFKLFGIIYGLDGLIGLVFGQGYLDGGIFLYGITPLDLGTRIATNLPHLAIGGLAVLIGFVVSRRYAAQS